VWFTGSSNTPSGPRPTGTLAGLCPQPDASVALQVAPLNTETLLSLTLATYTVSVRWSTAIPLGSFPTVIVGHGPLHRDTSCASQRRESITETVSAPELGPLSLLPLAT
jgi:hypothetical protein